MVKNFIAVLIAVSFVFAATQSFATVRIDEIYSGVDWTSSAGTKVCTEGGTTPKVGPKGQSKQTGSDARKSNQSIGQKQGQTSDTVDGREWRKAY